MLRTIAIVGFLLLILGVFERFFPAERGQSRRGRLRNVAFIAIFLFVGSLFVALIYATIPVEPRLLPDRGLGVSLLLVFAYIFLGDFIFYWYHRAQHAWGWFWPIHELHHSDAELNASTSMRTYWLERPLQTLAIAIPVDRLVGGDPTAILVLPFLLTGWLFFTHANIRLHLGRLTPVITGPQLHRIHHSILPEHRDKNFAQFFPILDIVFGTYYRPAGDEYPPTGTPDLASDASVGETLTRPVKHWMQAARTRWTR